MQSEIDGIPWEAYLRAYGGLREFKCNLCHKHFLPAEEWIIRLEENPRTGILEVSPIEEVYLDQLSSEDQIKRHKPVGNVKSYASGKISVKEAVNGLSKMHFKHEHTLHDEYEQTIKSYLLASLYAGEEERIVKEKMAQLFKSHSIALHFPTEEEERIVKEAISTIAHDIVHRIFPLDISREEKMRKIAERLKSGGVPDKGVRWIVEELEKMVEKRWQEIKESLKRRGLQAEVEKMDDNVKVKMIMDDLIGKAVWSGIAGEEGIMFRPILAHIPEQDLDRIKQTIRQIRMRYSAERKVRKFHQLEEKKDFGGEIIIGGRNVSMNYVFAATHKICCNGSVALRGSKEWGVKAIAAILEMAW